jgi:hypothetical protein
VCCAVADDLAVAVVCFAAAAADPVVAEGKGAEVAATYNAHEKEMAKSVAGTRCTQRAGLPADPSPLREQLWEWGGAVGGRGG